MTVSNVVGEGAQEQALYVSTNTHIDNYVLAANVAKNIAKPTNGNYALISADGAFWAAYDKTASTGSTDIADGTGSEYIAGSPAVWREVRAITNISVAATAARKVSVMWFK